MKDQFASIYTDNKGIIYNKNNINSIIITKKEISINFINETTQQLETIWDDKDIKIRDICNQLLIGINETEINSPIENHLRNERHEMEKRLIMSKELVKQCTLEELEELSEKYHSEIEYKLNNGLIYFINDIEIRDLLSEINTRKAFPREDIV